MSIQCDLLLSLALYITFVKKKKALYITFITTVNKERAPTN